MSASDVETAMAYREFDAKVAEAIMGWKNCRPRHSFDYPISGVGFGIGDPPEGWRGHLSTLWREPVFPPFTTDDGAAMLVLDELRRRFGHVRLEAVKSGADLWMCASGGAFSTAPTIALAVCRAALQAVGRKP